MKLTEESTGARVRALRAKTTLGDGPVALLVEPDEVGADVLTSVLRLLGFQVLRVRRGDEALHALSLGPVDLILLDADLPDLPAEQLLEVARKLPNYANARLVVTSAIHAEQSAVISGLRKRGAEEFFSRPYPVARIRHKLRAMFPLEQETSTKEKLSVRDAEALALPAAVIIGGVKRPVRLVAGNPSRCLLKGQSLPLGGTVHATCDEGRWIVTASGDRLSTEGTEWQALARGKAPDEISPALVQFALLPVVLADSGRVAAPTLENGVAELRY